MSFFNFFKKPSKGVSLRFLRQLELSGNVRLRIVVASDWSLARVDGSIPDSEDCKRYHQQGDTLYIGTGTNGGYSGASGGNNIAFVSNSVIGSIGQTADSTGHDW